VSGGYQTSSARCPSECRFLPSTVVRILRAIANLDQVKVNPSVFIDEVAGAMNEALVSLPLRLPNAR
jgi:hypothetical protein